MIHCESAAGHVLNARGIHIRLVTANNALANGHLTIVEYCGCSSAARRAARCLHFVVGDEAVGNSHYIRRINSDAGAEATETANDRTQIVGNGTSYDLRRAACHKYASACDGRIRDDRALADDGLASANV